MVRESKYWCLTINQTTELFEFIKSADEVDFRVWLPDELSYFVGQLEQGESGNLHYQCYVEFEKKKRFTRVQRLFPGAHIEAREGTAIQARDYCQKVESRVIPYGGERMSWEHGTISIPEQGNYPLIWIDDYDFIEIINQI